MKTNQKLFKLLPFLLIIIYYIINKIFPNEIYENKLYILISMILISLVSFGMILRKESLKEIKKQKIVQFSFGLFATFLVMVYFLKVA